MRRSQRGSEYISPPSGWFLTGLGDLEKERCNRRASEFSFGRAAWWPPNCGMRRQAKVADIGRSPPPVEPVPDLPQVIEHTWGYEILPRPHPHHHRHRR